MGSISAANAEFCFDLFRELKPQHINENIFYSPLSIISALAMVYLGTRGNTALQVEKCGEPKGIHFKFKDLLSEINSHSANYSLRMVNRLYAENTYSILPVKTKPVQMMHQAGFFKIASIGSEKIHILELPYANEELSMIILLPNDISDLDQLENTINFDKLMAWTSSTNMRKRKVEVYLPRMKLEEQYSLAPVLSSLGMTDLFTQSADLSGISTGKNLAVSEVIHKSHVEINEEGTEAAAATGVTIVLMSHVFPIKFKADHPFLFFIHHKKTNLILFYGRFSSP
uniref:Ovalbumin-like n=1 Tax=Crocodylus porosus TaxID=8502 RepID=A0A7M4E5P1_CROPO